MKPSYEELEQKIIELEKSEKRSRNVVESIEDIYFEVDLLGNLTFCNQAMAKLAEASINEIIGQSYRSFTEPHAAEKMLKSFHEIFKTGKHLKIEDYEVVTKTGKKKILEMSTSLIRDAYANPVGFQGIARDVTRRKEYEQELREANKRLERANLQLKEAIELAHQMAVEADLAYLELTQIFNATADGLCVIDRDYNIIRMNKNYSNLLKIDEESSIGRKCYDSLKSSLCESSKCPVKRIIFGGESRVEYDIDKKYADERKIPFILTATPLKDSEGNLVGIVENLKDVTDRKQADEEKLFNEKLQAVIETAGTICHELNQPMQVISGYVELILFQIQKEDKIYPRLTGIKQQIDRMGTITRKLMNITRYETKNYIKGKKIIDLDKASNN